MEDTMTRHRVAVLLGIVSCAALTPTFARADTYTSRTYNGGDSRGYTLESPSDWDSGNWKAECYNAERVLGISGTSDSSNNVNGAFGQVALCDNGVVETDGSQYSLHTLTSGSDDRADTGTGDWDVHSVKAECATDEVISGISQSASTPTQLVSKILCRKVICNGSDYYTSNESTGQCNTVMYSYPDNRLSSSDGDWSSGYMKNQCGDTQLFKGVSVNSDGTIHALLCCNYTTNTCIG
jgi:hypothetical protein